MALKRHRVGVSRENDLSRRGLTHDQRVFHSGLRLTAETIGDGVSDGGLAAGLRRYVDQPRQSLGEVWHQGKVTAEHYPLAECPT